MQNQPPLLPEEATAYYAKWEWTRKLLEKLIFTVGETVEVIEGPFAHFQGRVEEIDAEKEK